MCIFVLIAVTFFIYLVHELLELLREISAIMEEIRKKL